MREILNEAIELKSPQSARDIKEATDLNRVLGKREILTKKSN